MPDLVPTAAKVSGSEYRFKGDRLGLDVEFTTNNKGAKRAGPTVTKVYLQHTRRDRYELTSSVVPGLEPGDTDRTDDRANGRNRFPAGRYSLVVCVDAKDQEREENERNNCGQIAKKFEDFYSAYKQYAGTANGTGPGHAFDSNVRENWTATGVGFVWETYQGDGVFSYEVAAGGSATYTVSGTTSTNCVWSGSRALPFAGLPQSYLEVDWRQGVYGAALAPTGGYEMHSSCDPENPTTGPLTGWVFQTGEILGNVIALPFGSRTIAGSYADPLAIDVTNYSWNLAGG